MTKKKNSVSWNKQLFLALGLCALGGVAYWSEFKAKPKKEAAEEQAKKVFSLKDTSIKAISIAGFELRCDDFDKGQCKGSDSSKWSITQPIQGKADSGNITSLISSLSYLQINSTIDLSTDPEDKRKKLLEDYGLDPASRSNSRSVAVETAAGKTTLYIGKTHPIGDAMYALAEQPTAAAAKDGKPAATGTKVYLIPSHFKSSLDRDLTYWRNKKIFEFETPKVTQVRLEGSKIKATLNKIDGQWIVRPDGAPDASKDGFPGDLENIESFISAIGFTNAKDFPDPTATAKLKPSLKVVVTETEGDKKIDHTFTLYKKDGPQEKKAKKQDTTGAAAIGKVYGIADTNPAPYELEASTLERLDKGLKDLRMVKLISSVDRFGAKRIEFTSSKLGAKPYILTNKDGKWSSGQDKGTEKPADKTDQDKIQNFLDRISGNRITEFLAAKDVPGGTDTGTTVALGDEKTPAKHKFLFWKSGARLYVKDLLSTRKEAFQVDPTIAEMLPENASFFDKVASAKPDAKGGSPAGGDSHGHPGSPLDQHGHDGVPAADDLPADATESQDSEDT